MRASARGWIVVVGLVLAAAPALAQPTDPEERARVLYDKGTKHYALAEYDEAITAFKDAYKELEEPLFLYNIAQAYRQKRDCVNAVRFYKNYLRGESEGATADAARGFVTELEACAKEEEKSMGTGAGGGGAGDGRSGTGTGTGDGGTGAGDGGAGTGTGDGITTGGGVATTVAVVDRGKNRRLAGMVTGGVGVASLAFGVVMGIKAKNTTNRLSTTCTVAEPCEPDEWRTIHDQGESQQNLQVIGTGVGIVAIAAGAGLYLWGRASSHERMTVEVAPTAGGAGATVRWAF